MPWAGDASRAAPARVQTRPVRGTSTRILVTLLAALVAAAIAGCGSGGGGSSTKVPGHASKPDQPETVDSPAKLPDGWKTVVNKQAGFSIGLPPGWSVKPTEGAQGSVLSSPDELIAMTITADRTSGALELPLEDFATRTAQALGSDVVGDDRFNNLFVTKPAPFRMPDGYEAAAVRASGRAARTGLDELIFVVVVRRPGDAAYVVVSRENAEHPSKLSSRDDDKAIIRSIRGRPPE